MKDFLSKVILSIIGTLICLIPAWIYLLAKWIFSPEGFWQNFFLFGVGVYFLGFLQLVLLIVLVLWLLWIWGD